MAKPVMGAQIVFRCPEDMKLKLEDIADQKDVEVADLMREQALRVIARHSYIWDESNDVK